MRDYADLEKRLREEARLNRADFAMFAEQYADLVTEAADALAVIPILQRTLLAARTDTLEEAAKLAEQHAIVFNYEGCEQCDLAAKAIAQAIRRLSSVVRGEDE